MVVFLNLKKKEGKMEEGELGGERKGEQQQWQQ